MAGSASALRAARILQAGGTGTCASTDGDDARRSAAMSSSAVGVLVGAVARGLPPTAYSSTRPVLRNPLGTRAADARARPPVPTVHRRSSHVSGASPLSTCRTQRRMPPCLRMPPCQPPRPARVGPRGRHSPSTTDLHCCPRRMRPLQPVGLLDHVWVDRKTAGLPLGVANQRRI